MCGIFGIITDSKAGISASDAHIAMDKLFVLAESRGKEAAGISYMNANSIYVAKYAEPASEVIKKKAYKNIYHRDDTLRGVARNIQENYPVCMMGHSRLVTNGGQQIHANNQPVISSGMVAIHNGIITNVNELWKKHPQLEQKTQLDTEIFLALFRKYYEESNDLIKAVQATYVDIEGVASMAIYFEDINSILLTTNNGSLYFGENRQDKIYVFSSEKYFLTSFQKSKKIAWSLRNIDIHRVDPGLGVIIHLDSLDIEEFNFEEEYLKDISVSTLDVSKKIIDISLPEEEVQENRHIPGEGPYILASDFSDEFHQNKKAIDSLQRCTKCVLPETMPFIQFDSEGVCNYCHTYQPINPLGLEALQEVLKPYRKKKGEVDSLIAFSGGRDSSYGVHMLKTVLGMNPITYTYDWGMITDLGRRNQMRMCGELKVENILVSADLAKKRNNIQKNVLAWLKSPDLGTVPLFMAGDKQYFYYANKVGAQTGNKLVILCENLLETTRFKTGFCGIEPNFNSEHTYTLSLGNKFKLASYYATQYLGNPAYLNKSLLDTIGAYISYYFIPHNYLNIFQYIPWDEQEIDHVLIGEYNWETAPDTTTTWRIGDGTASFYNYIYYTLAGLTENDTFRSNQIREGMLTREEALALVEKENQPRYDSIQWYCDIVGVDFDLTIKKINNAKKLYQRHF